MIHLTLPVPNETPEVWNTFAPFVGRFCSTLYSIDPGADYRLHAVYTGEWTDTLEKIFCNVDHDAIHYPGQGWDIGAAQYVGKILPEGDLVINFTTRSYFHRPGWLAELVKARSQFGRGLYGTSASNQYRTHLCVRSYLIDVELFQDYPWEINSRSLGPSFETGVPYANPELAKNGVKSLTEFVTGLGLPVKVVRFDGIFDFKQSIVMPGGFRSGDQRQMLVWDKHSQIYAESSADYRKALEECTRGPSRMSYPNV